MAVIQSVGDEVVGFDTLFVEFVAAVSVAWLRVQALTQCREQQSFAGGRDLRVVVHPLQQVNTKLGTQIIGGLRQTSQVILGTLEPAVEAAVTARYPLVCGRGG
jgi:hypothetical protein